MSSRPFVDPAALLRFLEDLRRAGYRIGTEKISAAHDIAVMLAARGKDARKPDELCRMLRPLLCTTPAEQAEFNGRFQKWVGQLFPVAGAD